MFTALIVITLSMAYMLIGVALLLCYILAMKPQPQTVQLGFIVIFWPFVLLIDIGLALAAQFGTLGNALAVKLKARSEAIQ